MEINGKVLREVEFRDRLRGYDFEEVDEFLEQVAVAVDAMQADIAAHRESLKLAEERVEKAEALIKELEARPTNDTKPIDDEGIRKTLMLAQRTADMAIAEAKAEADKLLGSARSEAERILSEADEYVKSMKTEAEKGLSSHIADLTDQHERLLAEIKVLNQVLNAERARLTEALNGALRFVAQAFPMNEAVVAIVENGREGLNSLPDVDIARNEIPSAKHIEDATDLSTLQDDIELGRYADTGSTVDSSDNVSGDNSDNLDDNLGEDSDDLSVNVTASSVESAEIETTLSAVSEYEIPVDSGNDSLYSAIDIKNEPVDGEVTILEHGSVAKMDDAQRDDGLVDSLLQDMFESLGQENDDALWARFTSSSLDVNVIKREDTQSSEQKDIDDEDVADKVKENSDEGNITGEVLQFERNKRQDS